MKENIKALMPIPKLIHFINRKRLKNENFTLITRDCMAGIIYHNLGLQFTSPTINLHFHTIYDYYNFCNNLEKYLQLELEDPLKANSFPNKEEAISLIKKVHYPIAVLGDIIIHLNHYKTLKEAHDKWEERKKRVNLNNLYIISNDYIDDNSFLSDEYIRKFSQLKCKNIIILTQKETNIPYTKYIEKEKFRKLMNTNPYTGIRGLDLYFDYVDFLNNSIVRVK